MIYNMSRLLLEEMLTDAQSLYICSRRARYMIFMGKRKSFL